MKEESCLLKLILLGDASGKEAIVNRIIDGNSEAYANTASSLK